MLRYLTARLFNVVSTTFLFPISTLIVNVVASFFLGGVIGWVLARSADDEVRLLIGVGFCGGLSTFSSFSQETLGLLQANRWGTALVNISLNVVLCLITSWSGLVLGQRL